MRGNILRNRSSAPDPSSSNNNNNNNPNKTTISNYKMARMHATSGAPNSQSSTMMTSELEITKANGSGGSTTNAATTSSSSATASSTNDDELTDAGLQTVPLLNESDINKAPTTSAYDEFFIRYCSSNPEFFKSAFKFTLCFIGLQVSYLTWGYMQELIMTTPFTPTPSVPSGKFPSAAFCVFSNRFLAVIVALLSVRYRHGAFFSNNKAPLYAFTPCALSNTLSSWSQYASLKYVSFPVQTVFKSSKIIPVMIMGKCLKGTNYSVLQYVEAVLITAGVAIFSISSKDSSKNTSTELIGLFFLIMYVTFDSFTSQWQDKVYTQYGRPNVDAYQMMLGVNVSAIIITTAGLIVSGDVPIVLEFLQANPAAFHYNIITAITSASGQLCIFYTIKEFGPIVFTIIMTTRQLFSICLSSIFFGHVISTKAASGAILVFGVLFYQIQRKYNTRKTKSRG